MKVWMWGVLSAVAASVLTLLITNLVTSHEEGQDAIDRDQIEGICKVVVDKELKTDSGQTVGQMLTEMNGTLIEVKTEVRLQGEALRALTE